MAVASQFIGKRTELNGYRHRKMESTIRVQILDEFVRISLRPNAVGKRMNPSVLPLAMGK